MKRSDYLMDVVVIRLLLIFFLIFYHAFVIYTGGWGIPFDGFNNDIPAYYWMGYLSHAFQLEAMVFISGLLFGYAITKFPERLCFNGCVTKRAKRILLPSILFSILYYLLFYDKGAPWYDIVYKILNGCGHLWFLPMIFWCFVLMYLFAKFLPSRFRSLYVLLLCVAMNLLAVPRIPFGVGSMMTYFIFFYLGFIIRRGGIKQFRLLKTKESVLCILLYLALAVAKNYLQDIDCDGGIIQKATLVLSIRFLHLVGALSMIYALLSLANNARLQARIEKNDFLITMSGYCYGVYIYQQFILKYLYYNTSLPNVVSEYALPWIGLGITLVLSLLLCHLTLKTKFGRYLIG